MAFSLNLRTTGDYFILNHNCIPGRPKSGWTPALGELVIRSAPDGDNVWDLAAATENFQGIVISTNGATGTIGIAEFVDGTQIVLPTDAPLALNDKVRVSGGLKVVGTANFSRTQVQADPGGVGTVIDLAPFGASGTGTESTATVAFYSTKP